MSSADGLATATGTVQLTVSSAFGAGSREPPATTRWLATPLWPNSIYGGNGNDIITGGGAADRLAVAFGTDTLTAMTAMTRLGQAGNDTINGGNGLDTAYYTGSCPATRS